MDTYERQMAELADLKKNNGRCDLAVEVLAWAKRHEKGIDDVAMSALLRLIHEQTRGA